MFIEEGYHKDLCASQQNKYQSGCALFMCCSKQKGWDRQDSAVISSFRVEEAIVTVKKEKGICTRNPIDLPELTVFSISNEYFVAYWTVLFKIKATNRLQKESIKLYYWNIF
ncbi:hypothetical protein ABEB36_012402 [Hypothenemus hampei]|uniref:Uncharacterized protein n=1 Tax=Hypothenemus hampei TaxID=57062 RepID=A0ABD1EB51_HYPHA